LQSAGVNIGPQVKGLEDMASAAGKTASQLGVLGTAGLVAGAALTGWKIGTWLGEVTGATTAVENLAKSVLGYSDALDAVTSGAKQDVLTRASITAHREITNYTEAIQINEAAFKQHAAASVDWTMKLAEAYKQVRNLTDAQEHDIAIMQEAGAKTEDITAKYGLSAKALEILADKHRDAAKATEEHRAAQEKLNKEAAAGLADFQAQTDVAKAWQPIIDENIKKRDASAAASANQRAAEMQHAEATAAETKATTDYLTEQDRMTAENDAAVAALNNMAGAHTEAAEAATSGGQATAAAYAGVTQQVNISADAIRAWIGLMQYTNQSNAILSRNSLYTTQSQRDELARLPIPSFAGGVENFDGGLAKVHAGELLVNLPGGTSVIPKGQGGNVTMANTFNLVDSESNLARRVSELIMRSVRAGTQLGTT
jgi:hypothetical protein